MLIKLLQEEGAERKKGDIQGSGSLAFVIKMAAISLCQAMCSALNFFFFFSL